MTKNSPDIPKTYADDQDLTEAQLDDSFKAVSTYQSNNEQNWKQALLDIFKVGYTLDNDGVSNYSKSLEEAIDFPGDSVYYDDFLEQAQALASTTVSNAHLVGSGTNGTQAVTASTGGVLRLDTSNVGSSTSVVAFREAVFDTLKAPVLEFRIKTDDITNTEIKAGFRVDANDYVYFNFNTATSAANIYLATNNNGAGEIATDTGIDLTASTYLKFKIAIAGNAALAVFIDDVQVATAHTGGIRSLATFVPYFYVDNKAAAESKKMDIDYIRVLQQR